MAAGLENFPGSRFTMLDFWPAQNAISATSIASETGDFSLLFHPPAMGHYYM
jgi:hypothetical protein